jgi:hypothetical protein
MSIKVSIGFIKKYCPTGWDSVKYRSKVDPETQEYEVIPNPCLSCSRIPELRDEIQLKKAARIERFLHSEFGLELYQQFLIRKGVSAFITGVPDSGKTQLDTYLLEWLAPLETIVKWDTGKGDILPLFNFGKPIQFLIPYGCKLEIRGVMPCEYIITPVMAPELYFRMIKKDWINIISVRNFFVEEDEMKKYVRDMFNNFLLSARLDEFADWTPAVIDLDEAHAIVGSGRIDKSDIAQKTGQGIGNSVKESRKKEIRFILISQGYYDLPAISRENTPLYGVKRGTVCEKRDNPTINYLSGFARECESRHGWIVLPNGKYYGRVSPMAFPFYPDPPGIKIMYHNFKDRESKDESDEMMPDLGRYSAAAIPPEKIACALSISQVPEVLVDDEQRPVRFEMPESWKEPKKEMIES